MRNIFLRFGIIKKVQRYWLFSGGGGGGRSLKTCQSAWLSTCDSWAARIKNYMPDRWMLSAAEWLIAVCVNCLDLILSSQAWLAAHRIITRWQESPLGWCSVVLIRICRWRHGKEQEMLMSSNVKSICRYMHGPKLVDEIDGFLVWLCLEKSMKVPSFQERFQLKEIDVL